MRALSAPRMTVGIIGLTGPVGVLPRHYSDAVVADQRTRAFSLTDFLDLISHRMVAAFAAAGAKYRPHRAADLGALAPDGGARRPGSRSAAGLDRLCDPASCRPLARRIDSVAPLRRILFRPSAFGGSARSVGLRLAGPAGQGRAIRRAPGWPCRSISVRACRWACRLAASAGWVSMRRRACAPGTSRRESCCRIGPLDLPYFERLLPDRPLLRELVSLVRAFVGFEVGFAVNPVLARDAVPPLAMPPSGRAGCGRRRAAARLEHLAADIARPAAANGCQRAFFEGEIVEGRA